MTELIDQPTGSPTRKVMAAGIGGAISTIFAFFAMRYGGLDIPADVMAAITLVISVGLAYITKERAPEM